MRNDLGEAIAQDADQGRDQENVGHTDEYELVVSK